MRILIIGGTRFVGVSLTKLLVAQGHEVVLFNRGNHPAPVAGIEQIIGDRSVTADLTQKLSSQHFDAIFDNNGREQSDTQPLAELFAGKVQHFVYMSSAGVYLPAMELPHKEGDAVDPKSRHKGKHETEAYLSKLGIPFTSIRPTYIYGPQNYNQLESWFFDRLVRDRPVPIPGNGLYITQLGHVADLAAAMAQVLGCDRAIGQIYNVSGDRYLTFDNLARACAVAIGKSPESAQIVHYDPKSFDFGKRKAFPFRTQHFFAAIDKATRELNWRPKYDLVSGLKDSFHNDYLATGKERAEVDFSVDEQILA